jgi:hypothetical protein
MHELFFLLVPNDSLTNHTKHLTDWYKQFNQLFTETEWIIEDLLSPQPGPSGHMVVIRAPTVQLARKYINAFKFLGDQIQTNSVSLSDRCLFLADFDKEKLDGIRQEITLPWKKVLFGCCSHNDKCEDFEASVHQWDVCMKCHHCHRRLRCYKKKKLNE